MNAPPTPWPITPLGDTPANDVGDMLGRAFLDNPITRAALSHCTEQERLRRVIRLHHGLVRAALAEGGLEIVRADGRVVGASLFFAPGTHRGGARAFAWMLAGALGVGARGAYRYWIYDKHVAPLHPAARHSYLFVLGVEPAWQGRGIGAALLERFCERVDRAGAPGYLETDKASSVRLYERHGFGVEHEIEIAGLGGLRAWTMLRPPHSSPAPSGTF